MEMEPRNSYHGELGRMAEALEGIARGAGRPLEGMTFVLSDAEDVRKAVGRVVTALGGAVVAPTRHGITINGGETEYQTFAEALAALADPSYSGEVTLHVHEPGLALGGTETWNGGNAAITKVVVLGEPDDRAAVIPLPEMSSDEYPWIRTVCDVAFRNVTLDGSGHHNWFAHTGGGSLILDGATFLGGLAENQPVSADRGLEVLNGSVVDGQNLVDIVMPFNCSIHRLKVKDSTVKGGQKLLVNLQYTSDAEFVNTVFDGTGYTRTGEDAYRSLVQLSYATLPGTTLFKGCTFKGLARTVGGVDYWGSAISDFGNNTPEADIHVVGCTFEGTVRYVLGAETPEKYTMPLHGKDNVLAPGVIVGKGCFRTAVENDWPEGWSVSDLA